jgi:asparagine synthase (glutamine-hydrolysing)
MCGIIGMLGKDAPDFVSKNIDSLQKRGPDSQNVVNVGNSLSLGATRLSMIDRHSRSDQPMVDDSDNILIFNGEIYNFLNLRKTLSDTGINFKTESDTEVLLKLLGVKGDKAISKLEGMFAFAYYNKRDNTILLSRDFLGKKPLFYSISEGLFVFSSSLNLVKSALQNAKLNSQSVYSYLKIGYVPDPATMFKQIHSVAPGEILVFDITQGRIVDKKTCIPEAFLKIDSISVEDSLCNAIQQRVSGNSNFAISLSGGIDSSIIALLCKKLGLSPIAYSLGFSNSDKERYSTDSIKARQISDYLGLEFELVEMPKPELIPSILNEFVRAMEEPNSNPTGLSMMWLYSKISNDGFRMVLTGDGGDEIFGGYSRYLKLNSIERFPKLSFNNFSGCINDGTKFSKNLIRLLSRADSETLWLTFHSLMSDKEISKLTKIESKISLESQIFDFLYSKFGIMNKTSAVMIRDLVTWLSSESNRRLDRVSMNYSIEARSPFQSELVIGTGYNEMKNNKFKDLKKNILIKNIDGISNLPLINKKTGFTSPLGYWLRSNSKLIDISLEQVRSHIFIRDKDLNLLKSSATRMDSYNFKILWSLIVLAKWFELNL